MVLVPALARTSMTTSFAGPVVPGAIAAILLGAAVSSAQPPSLAELARREQDRRKAAPPATRVLTNKDLPKVVTPPAPAAAADANPSNPDAAAPIDTAQDAKEPVKDEASWRARISEPRERLHRDEVLLDALKARVNGLTSDFAGRDDPYQRARIGQDRREAIVEMERVGAEIVELRKKIEDIEEEARKSSVPPGWLR